MYKYMPIFMITSLFSAIHSMNQKEPIHLAIFVSGNGTNMEAILDKNIEGIKPCIVISNRAKAPALQKARSRNIPAFFISGKDAQTEEYNEKLFYERVYAHLNEYNVTPENGLICLAGFMKLLSSEFVQKFKGRILNIHPSLLPAFKGKDAIKQAFEYGVKVTGCTVHFVDEEMDTGPIVLQETVTIEEDDTLETLEDKVHAAEHTIYPKAVALFAHGKLKLDGKKVKITY